MELKLDKPIIFFDLETTGINFVNDRIVEFCFLRINPDGTQKVWTQRINPGMPIPKEATAIHHITDEDVKDMPSFKSVAHEVSQFLAGCDLGGFNNIKFDIPFIAEEFLRAEVDFDLKGKRFVDVLNIFHKMEQRNLKAAYRFYCNQELDGAHSAEADTLATYEILKSQLDRYVGVEYEDKFGSKQIPIHNDMQALHDFSYHNRSADLAGQLIFNDKNQEIFNFGKYKGMTVESVFSREPSYYDWMMKADFPLYTKKVITAIKLRNFNQK
ncbi:MAG: exonuclease domain-containing protein [Bacteroidota bacterium]